MPEIPSFMQVRDWIKEAGQFYGVSVSVRHAKSLAGKYLDSLEHNPLTYSDETGEEACRRWFASRCALAN